MHKAFMFAIALFAASMTLLNGQQPKKPSIARLDSTLDAVVPSGAQLEVLVEGFKDGLEGGVWNRKGGYLLFSNKPERLINKWTPDGKLSVYLNLAEVAKIADPKASLSSGTTMDREGRLVYCSPGERAVIRIEPDGKRTIVAAQYQGKRLSHPNDLVYKSDGTLYFTDNGDPPAGEIGELPTSAYLLKNGQIHLITTGQLEHPNGIAVSPDEKFLYINDSAKRQVWRFEIQPDDTAINGRLWLNMSSDKAAGVPDGMRVDKKGNVYDAGPGGIWIVSPEGKHIGTLLIPPPDRPTNLAFGGADGKTLYLMNHTSLYRIRLNIEGVRP
jgi:gluconolactonase